MKEHARSKYPVLASISLLLLCACEQLGVEAEMPPQQASSESELMRKNGNALIESGKPQEAIIVFDKLIETEPHNALAYNGKAVAFDHSGNHLAAQELYKTALSLSPDSLTIRNNLAMSMILNNQIDQATKLLESLVQESKDSNPTSHIIRHNLALAYGLSGEHEKATKLNLRDMTKKQAEENIEFYKQYSTRNNSKPAAAGAKKKEEKQNIGFITSPPAVKLTTPAKIEAKTQTSAKIEKASVKEPQKPLPQKAENKDKSDLLSELNIGSMNYDYPK